MNQQPIPISEPPIPRRRAAGRRRWLAGAAVLGLLLAACGDDSDSSDDEADAGSGGGGEVETGSLSGEPIEIGFINLEGGSFSLPQNRIGAEVAASYVNTELGGVNGRPIEYFTCDTDGSPERSIDCANQFLERGVPLVQMGVDLGIDAALPVLQDGGVPLVSHNPFSPGLNRAEDAYFFGTSARGATAAALRYFADDGAETVRFFMAEDPVAQDIAEGAASAAESLGLDYDTIFYDGENPDWATLVASVTADDPDVVGSPAAIEPHCIGFVSGLRNSGFDGDILAGTCSAFVAELGEQAEGVITVSDVWRPDDPTSAPEPKQEEIETYVTAMTDAGHEDLIGSFAFNYFSDTVTLAEVLSTIEGDIDGPTVSEALRSTVGLDAFMGSTVSCDGSVAPGQTACNGQMLIYEVSGDGGQQAVTDDFLDISDLLSD